METEYSVKDTREEEDEESYAPFSSTSKVVELLKAKVKLDNGEDGYVFTKNTDENPRGRFRCHVCNVPIGSTKSLEEHASGKNHTRKMQANFHSHENFSKIVIKESSKLCTDLGGKVIKAPGVDIPDLAPGEPVPPGFEDIVTRVPEITSTLEEMKAPLIGLEYLAEITPIGDEVEPKYCCLLCNKRGDPRTVLAHLVCFNHRIKYIGRYFPRTNTALALIPKVKEYKRGTGEVLAKIVKAIENKLGRLKPTIVDGAVFDEKKEEIYREMSAGRHFHETADSNYELLVDLDFIKRCAPEADTILTIDIEREEAKKRSTSLKNETDSEKVDKKPYDRITRAINLRKKREKSVETISTSRSRSCSRSKSRSYSRSRSPSVSRSRSYSKSHSRARLHYRVYRDYEHRDSRSRTPRYYCRSRSRSPSRSRSRSRGPSYRRYRSSSYKAKSPVYIKSSYRTIRYDSLYNDEDDYPLSERPKSIQLKVAELRDKRKKKDLYAEYVEKLEKDMAKTLKSYKKNPEKHPLYPDEWKKFWNRRYKELTAEGIDASKHDFKPEWIKFWTVRMKELHTEELQMKKEKYRIELGLQENDSSGYIDSDIIEVSPTPLEDDKGNVTVDDIKNTWKALTGSEIKSSKEGTPEQKDDYDSVDQPVRVITVLRLLTALESQLGSLGPRVNNVLAQAIALEKKKPYSSDTLIDISENNVLFETVKEKLKGQLFAGIVEKHMVKATRTAIQNVAELFNSWKSRKNNPEPTTPAAPVFIQTPVAPSSEPLIVPGIGPVDKVAIAQQIAAALIAQGKTNVTEQELEQLISAVVGMAHSTTPSTPVTPTLSSASLTPVMTQSVPSSPSTGVSVQKETDSNSKPNIFQHFLSSVSKSSWGSESSNSKPLQAYDETPNSKIRKVLFSKDIGDLSEEEMKTLLQNFKDLSSEEQQSVIHYLKELEDKDPESVEKLRQFLNSAVEINSKNEIKPKEDNQNTGRLSPFSMREGGANPFIDDGSKISSNNLDDDEDDYSYEDIYKAAEKKISGKSVAEKMIEEQQKKVKLAQSQASPLKNRSLSLEPVLSSSKNSDDPECVLSEAKVMIANIMGQLPSKYSNGTARCISGKTSNTSKSPAPIESPPPITTITTSTTTTTIYSSQPLYDTVTTNIPVSKNSSNNLLNDYNYQDDIFGYTNDSYQNYSESSENYRVDSNTNNTYNQLHQPSYGNYPAADQTYSNYENWNTNYSQYPPPQQENYNCNSHSQPIINSNFNIPPEPYQDTSNEYNGPHMYNNTYREYY